MKSNLLPIVRDRAAVGFAAIAAMLVTVVALALTAPALAQFTPDSPTLSDAADDPPAAAAEPPAEVPVEGTTAPAATVNPPAEVPVERATSSAAASSASDNSAADRSGWVRSNDEDSSANPPDKVLEVPQVVNPADGQPAADTGGQAAPNGDSSAPDQVGSVDDYQDEGDGDIGGAYLGAAGLNPYGVRAFRGSPGPLNPTFGPSYVPFNSSGPNIGRPSLNGMNTAIGSTSPMLPGPRNLAPLPGGWPR